MTLADAFIHRLDESLRRRPAVSIFLPAVPDEVCTALGVYFSARGDLVVGVNDLNPMFMVIGTDRRAVVALLLARW